MITYKAITSIEPERDVLRCLPELFAERMNLLSFQKCFGIGAYNDGSFVGSLWFYAINDPSIGNPYAPDWTGLKLGSEEYLSLISKLSMNDFPTICLRCFHVGRTKQTETTDKNDESYYGKGIGTGLLRTAIKWAKVNSYKSIITKSGLDGFDEFNNWAGSLPLKTYVRNGFEIISQDDWNKVVPGHLKESANKYETNKYIHATIIHRLFSI